MSSEERYTLLNAIVHTLERDLSARTVLFHTSIAERLGLNTTDHKALDVLYHHGSLTAGMLAEWTGLTAGAVTGIIDRLERAGFVRRVKAPHDRRQVIIEPIPERQREVDQLFESMAQAMMTLTAQYSDDKLQVIYDYLTRTIGVLQEETAKIQANTVTIFRE